MLYRYENWKYPEIMKCTFVFEEKKRRILGTFFSGWPRLGKQTIY
jgi:hypothetical protein